MAKAKEMVSSTFAMLIVISIPTAIMLIAAVAYYDTYNLFNVNPDIVSGLDTILIVAIILVCSTFTFKFLGNFYMGLQLPAVNNLLVTSGRSQHRSTIGCLSCMLSHYILLEIQAPQTFCQVRKAGGGERAVHHRNEFLHFADFRSRALLLFKHHYFKALLSKHGHTIPDSAQILHGCNVAVYHYLHTLLERND